MTARDLLGWDLDDVLEGAVEVTVERGNALSDPSVRARLDKAHPGPCIVRSTHARREPAMEAPLR